MNPIQQFRRRGSVYVMVVGTATAITVIGLSALTLARIERRRGETSSDFAQARLYAESAINLGLLRIDQNLNWRASHTSGAWEVNKPIGNGQYTLEGIDPVDGVLANSTADALLLRGAGVAGDAQYKLEVRLDAEIMPLTCLERPLHAGNDISFNLANVESDVAISANRNMSELLSTINADAEAGGTIVGLGFQGTKTAGIVARSMPGTEVFDYYIANGTAINLSAIPSGTIEKVVLSPQSNPYGPTKNAQGIYVIGCGSQDIEIRDSRIVGTLVLLDTGGGSKIRDSINWEPKVPNYPSLLVRGKMAFELNDVPLNESSKNVNYNPLGSGYKGISDNDKVDIYPSVLNGLVYVSSDATMKDRSSFDGVVVFGNNLSVTQNADFTYQSIFLNNPPPGFTAPPRMVIADGSWRQIID